MMAHFRIVDGVALSIAAVAIGVVGCGASDNGPTGANTAISTGGATNTLPGTGATPAGAGATVTTPPSGTGATASTPPPGAGGTYTAPPGAGGTVVVTPGAGGTVIQPTGGGGTPATGGATAVGGAASGGSTGVAGGPTVGDPTGWTTATNLDGNGKLIAPAAGAGYQINTPTFTLNPGQEVFRCFHSAMGNPATFDVGEWESQMTPGSHHFILYRADGDSAAAGTLATAGCTVGFGGPTWLYTSGTPHSHLPFPDGVAMELGANQRMLFDMHYINTGSDPIQVHVTLNVNQVKAAEFQKAQAQISFNTGIFIPPNGMQTVGGDCTPPTGAKFFIMSTHTHKRGIEASITRKLANGMLGEELVKTTNWDAPTANLWFQPPYLTFAAGEKFHYSCTYQNDRSTTVTVGTSAETNEMCMAITYFFPATSGGSCN
jgi:hypothetical protein